jgi:glycosyltransferase involved in cell wall biosynthesis
MISPIFLSIVMPAYNEEGQIRGVIGEHIEMASRLPPSVSDWEIVCLDDASADATPALLAEFSRAHDKVRVVNHETNQGIFASFHDVCQAARGTHVYMTAADGQWPAENILVMLAELEAGADLVVGVRTNRRDIYSFRRRVVSYSFNILVRLLYGVETGDAGSIKLGSRAIFQMPLVSRSPFAEAERIVTAHQLGYRIVSVPIRFLPRSSGKASGAGMKNILDSLRDCLKVRFGSRGSSLAPKMRPDSQKSVEEHL